MTGMKCFPDKYFDLAIVDPVYGDVTNGGYMKNQIRGGVGPYKDYDLSIWQQQKTGQEYFDELFRVSRNQIIWGGGITFKLTYPRIPNAGLFGTNAIQME
jgi:site-specific DNA-methyltransferase (adenine-specific)